MASLHHHYFIAHPTEQKDGNESGIETLSFFFPQERTSVCKPRVGSYLKAMLTPP
jgi:hypothetical protein